MWSASRSWAFVVLTAMVLANLPLSRASADEREDAIKAFSAFVGSWDTGYTCTASKGGRFVFYNSEKEPVSIIGWDPGEKRLMSSGFGEDGKHWVDAIQVLGEGKFRIERLFGDKSEHPITITCHGKDTFDWVTANGETTKISRVTKPGAEKAGQADGEKVVKSFTDIVVGGVWTTSTESVVLEHTYNRTPPSTFVRLSMQGGPFPGMGVVGVDPVTNQCTLWMFLDDGTVTKGILTHPAEGTWRFDAKGLGPNGTVVYRSKLTLVDRNTVKEELIEVVRGEEKLPTSTYTWTRKQ